jgi:hypothetical protein
MVCDHKVLKSMSNRGELSLYYRLIWFRTKKIRILSACANMKQEKDKKILADLKRNNSK